MKVVLELSHDEALVLFDTLARMNASGKLDDAVAQQSLDDLEALLETRLPEVTSPDYDKAVEKSRNALSSRRS